MSQCPVGLTRGLTLTVHQEPIHPHKIHKPNCCTGIFGEGEGLLGQTTSPRTLVQRFLMQNICVV